MSFKQHMKRGFSGAQQLTSSARLTEEMDRCHTCNCSVFKSKVERKKREGDKAKVQQMKKNIPCPSSCKVFTSQWA